MIAANNKNMQEAGETLYTLSKEEQIRYQCEAREDYRRTWNTVKLQFEEYQSTIDGLKSTIAENNSTIASLENTIARLQAELQQK